MANTFKMATKSSVVTDAVSSSLILLSVLVSNKGSNTANVDVYVVTNSGDDVYLLKGVPIPAGSSLELISGSKVIMESSDVLRIRADTATTLDATVSYLDQT